MTKLTGEVTAGLVVEVTVLISEHLRIREPFIIWGLFGLGLALVFDAILRGDWASNIFDADRRASKRRKLAGVALVLFVLFGLFIRARMPKESEFPTVAALKENPTTPKQDEPKQDQPIEKAEPFDKSPATPKSDTKTALSEPRPVAGTKSPSPAPAPTQSCPNGICIGGDNSGSAKVENYNGIYPPPNVTPTIFICAKPSVIEGDIYKTPFSFKTDTEISTPAWWFLFDGPVIDVSVSADKVIGFMRSHPPCDKFPMCDRSLGITLDNIGGIGSQLPWGPTTPFTATVTSKQPVNLLEEHGRSMDKPLNENYVMKCD